MKDHYRGPSRARFNADRRVPTHHRGGVETLQGRRPLDRYRSHSGIFSTSGSFSAWRSAIRSPWRVASSFGPFQAYEGRSDAQRSAMLSTGHTACRGYAAILELIVTAIIFPHVECGR
jgi:hypothetical protein